jgi:hypothetical protein
MDKFVFKKKNREKKIFLPILFVFIFVMSFISSAPFASPFAYNSANNLGVFKQNTTINITQVCYNATYITLTSVTYPNSTKAVNQSNMTSQGSGEFIYVFKNATISGRYNVMGISNGCDNTFATYFDVTPSGNSGLDNIYLYILIILLSYGIALIGFFGKSVWVAVIGGLAMVIFGIYVYTQGIIIYINWVTNTIAALSVALGAFFVLYSTVEYIESTGDFE